MLDGFAPQLAQGGVVLGGAIAAVTINDVIVRRLGAGMPQSQVRSVAVDDFDFLRRSVGEVVRGKEIGGRLG